ncbi:MAG: hypothetical protein A2W23_10105 [Planctomycetes bacterium RBG_16_43_13]|nr:MAG: hypothetical protein A2W23_10105 [Planctomycetes bacterium RBG_16_43_13]
MLRIITILTLALLMGCPPPKQDDGVKPPPPTNGGTTRYQDLRKHSYSEKGEDVDPELSADGKTLYFATSSNSLTFDIYEKATDGTTVRQITSDPSNERFPKICPTNPATIAFSSDRDGGYATFYIKDFNKEPSKWVKISENNSYDLHPAWSSDGTKITYCSTADFGEEWVIKIYDLTTNARYKLPIDGILPEWSPVKGDNRIVFQRMKHRDNWFSEIWLITFDGKEAKSPTKIVASSDWAAINPAWSQDGKYITFATVGKSKTRKGVFNEADDIWTVQADGGGLTQITTDDSADWMPTWATDGRIYFISKRLGAQNIWSLKPSIPTTK